VIITAATGSTVQQPPTDDNSSGTYTQLQNALKATSADILGIWVRNALIASAVSTIFTLAPGTTTGGGLAVLKVTGMFRTGSAASRSTGSQANQASGTPAPVLGGNALTTNPVIAAVFNATNPAAMTPRSSPAYTELVDTGWATPTTGIEIMAINSGETAQTITWGSSSASAFCSVVTELDNAQDTPELRGRPGGLSGGRQLQQLLAQ
jgi:hypothetical protein